MNHRLTAAEGELLPEGEPDLTRMRRKPEAKDIKGEEGEGDKAIKRGIEGYNVTEKVQD